MCHTDRMAIGAGIIYAQTFWCWGPLLYLFIFATPAIVIASYHTQANWLMTECDQCTHYSIDSSGIFYVGYVDCQYYVANSWRNVTLQYPITVPWLAGKSQDDVNASIHQILGTKITCYVENTSDQTRGYYVKPTMWTWWLFQSIMIVLTLSIIGSIIYYYRRPHGANIN